MGKDDILCVIFSGDGCVGGRSFGRLKGAAYSRYKLLLFCGMLNLTL